MYFEEGQCLQCGSPVSDKARNGFFNQPIAHSDNGLKYLQVYFCHYKCRDKMMELFDKRNPAKPDRNSRLEFEEEQTLRNWLIEGEKEIERNLTTPPRYKYDTIKHDLSQYNEIRYAQSRLKTEYDDRLQKLREKWNTVTQADIGEADYAARTDFAREYRANKLVWEEKQATLATKEQERLNKEKQREDERLAKESQKQKEWDEKHPPEVPAVIPAINEAYWYGHALLLAQTRFGKTNVIRWRLNQLLPQIAVGNASVVMMEPKGVLTDEVLRLADVYRMRDRLVILDPMDTRASVNIFDKGDGSDYAIEETIGRVERVLSNVTSTLTAFQVDALTYALRAMFHIDQPGSIRLLTKILKNGLRGLDVGQLPYVVEQYFADFKAGDSAAMQVVNRLNGLVANPVFEALFDADRSTFNMFDEIQAGKLIVINASASNNLYARFWIEQIASCVRPRFKIPFAKRIPTTFIIDEAQTWISDDLHFASILDKAAEARIGMLIALHDMSHIKDPQVRGSIYTNTTLKFTAKTSSDITALSRSMGNTEPEFLTTLPQYEFAHFGPNMDRAIKVKVPLVEFDKMEHTTESQYQEMRAANKKAYSYVRAVRPVPPPELAKVPDSPPTSAKIAESPKSPQPASKPSKSPTKPTDEDDGTSFVL